MPGKQAHHLATDLQVRHVCVQQHPIDAFHLERDMPFEHFVDVHHVGHHLSLNATNADVHRCKHRDGRGPGEGPPSPR